MAPNLFPIGYDNEVIALSELSEHTPTGYRPSSKFSWDTRDFLKTGNYQIQNASGVEAWEDWCMICLSTERYDHMAYNTDFGIETKEAFRAESREKAESILTRQITEALMADPYERTRYVSEIIYHWVGPDSVSVRVTVEGIDDVSIDIVVRIDSDRR